MAISRAFLATCAGVVWIINFVTTVARSSSDKGTLALMWVTPLPMASANSMPTPPRRWAWVNAGSVCAARPTRAARWAAPGDTPSW